MASGVSSAVVSSRSTGAVLAALGRVIFAFAIVALGVETFVRARSLGDNLGFNYSVVAVLPWLPAGIPWLAYLFGAIWIACAIGLLSQKTRASAAIVLGILISVCALILEVPKAAVHASSMSLRTIVFEPLSIAALAWLIPSSGVPRLLAVLSRYILAVSFIVFGVDHFLALAGIGTLVPSWIPWHVFWIAFFGALFVAAGLSFALHILERWAAIGIGLMFAIWVLTLHIPRTLGYYGIPNALHDPNEWSSLFIAIALCGGPWAISQNIASPSRSLKP
ncbi:MAG TPA: hypothetical protein VMB47_00320 [Candidatus Aquilonibacter sp.]|nr:hypothetical protein [Candidatus Aquilonibacter sp.]